MVPLTLELKFNYQDWDFSAKYFINFLKLIRPFLKLLYNSSFYIKISEVALKGFENSTSISSLQ